MSFLLVCTLALAAVLFVAYRRFVRPRSTWEAFRREAGERAQAVGRELLRANEAISDAEALEPVLAALAEMPLPPGVDLTVRRTGPGQAVAEVTSDAASYMLRLSHSRYRPAGMPGAAHAGAWLLNVENAAGGAEPIPPESFDDLAAYVERLQTLLAAPHPAHIRDHHDDCIE